MNLHRRAIVIDACAPILNDFANAEYWQAGEVTCAFATMSLFGDTISSTMVRIGNWLHQLAQHQESIMLATTTDDIRNAKDASKLAIVLAFQNSSPLEYEVSLIEVFHRLGVRSMILAYNRAEAAGDGCMEERNGGLTWFGRQVVSEMNRVGMLVDLSHCGHRTSLEAIDASAKPVAFTHSGVKAVFEHPRNLSDEQIRAVAARGGVIGINGHAVFVKDTTSPTLDDLLDHFDHVASLVGVDCVGIGFDFSQPPGAEMPEGRYRMLQSNGVWAKGTLPPPPWRYPIESAAHMPLVTEGLLRRGYSDQDVEKILGGNFLRLLDQVW